VVGGSLLNHPVGANWAGTRHSRHLNACPGGERLSHDVEVVKHRRSFCERGQLLGYSFDLSQCVAAYRPSDATSGRRSPADLPGDDIPLAPIGLTPCDRDRRVGFDAAPAVEPHSMGHRHGPLRTGRARLAS